MTVAKVTSADYALVPIFRTRKMRISLMLTQQELANLAGVPREEVDSFERNLPVRLGARNKILKELLGRRQLGAVPSY